MNPRPEQMRDTLYLRQANHDHEKGLSDSAHETALASGDSERALACDFWARAWWRGSSRGLRVGVGAQRGRREVLQTFARSISACTKADAATEERDPLCFLELLRCGGFQKLRLQGVLDQQAWNSTGPSWTQARPDRQKFR